MADLERIKPVIMIAVYGRHGFFNMESISQGIRRH